METSSPEQIRKTVRAHMMLAGIIALLTASTVGIAIGIDLPAPSNMVVALLIAAVQATIVGYFLMHLKSETPLIYKVLLLTAVFLLVMFALSGLAVRNGIPKIF